MLAESNKTAVDVGNPDSIAELTIADTDWTSKVLEQAFYKDELLNYIYGDTIHRPGKLNGFFRTTFRLAAFLR